MLYHGYRITFAELLPEDACILISRRHSDDILAAVSSISQAIAWVREVETQVVLPFNVEAARG